jgi:hypothetical protein
MPVCPKCKEEFARDHWREWFGDSRRGLAVGSFCYGVVALPLLFLVGWISGDVPRNLEPLWPVIIGFGLLMLGVNPVLSWFTAPSLIHFRHTALDAASPEHRAWMRRWPPIVSAASVLACVIFAVAAALVAR